MKRNTLFGGLALLAAGGAIGAGAMVSGNAMASTGDPAATDQLTMVSVGSDGEPFQCSFEGADVKGLLPDVPVGSSVVVGSAEITPASGDLPELVVSGGGDVPAGALDGAVTVVASALPVGADGQDVVPVPADASVQMLTVDDAREGTAEECAALHDQAVQIASQVAAGGTQVLISSGTVAAVKP